MTAFNRPVFFNAVRASGLCGKTLSQTVVDGLTGILDASEKYQPGADLRHVAYPMATAWHEARLNAGIREIGRGAGHTYGKPAGPYGLVYYGRGPCQLTWYDNYVTFGKLMGVDLARFPDKALEPEIGAAVLIVGSRDGLFRKGRSLSRFFSATVDDAVGARDIINGDRDKVEKNQTKTNGQRIAAYHQVFLSALRAAAAAAPAPASAPVPTPASGGAKAAATAAAHGLGSGIRDALDSVHTAIHDVLRKAA